jgi:hypothetical protein
MSAGREHLRGAIRPPVDFEKRARALLAHVGRTESDLRATLAEAAGLVTDTADACAHRLSDS